MKHFKNIKVFSANRFLLFGLIFLFGIIAPPFAMAQSSIISSIQNAVFGEFFYAIAFIISSIVGVFVTVAAFLTKVALEFNFNIFASTNSLITVGWTIVRDIANLGFVLVIIIMAIATILRRESYGAQKLLPKLIAAAILVNFSLTIAGVFIDFSHVLTNFFFSRIASTPLEFAQSIAGAFNPQRIWGATPQGLDASFFGNAIAGVTQGIINLFFVTIFGSILVFALLCLAFMFLIRYLWLTLLLIVSPIVWLFWIIPDLSGKFSEWWSKFLSWVFFMPASSFFLYLALVSANNLQNSVITNDGSLGVLGTVSTLASQGAQMIILCGILVGGLMMAQKMGIEGAAGSMKLFNKGKGAVLGWAGKQATKASSYPLRTIAGRKFTERLQGLGANQKGFTKAVTLPFRKLGSAISDVRMATERKVTAGVGDVVKKRSIEENRRRFDSVNAVEQAEILKFLKNAEKSGDDESKKAALKALSNIPSEKIQFGELRVKFLYGGGGKGAEGGDERHFGFKGQEVFENLPETRFKKGGAEGKTEGVFEELKKSILDEEKEKNKGSLPPTNP